MSEPLAQQYWLMFRETDMTNLCDRILAHKIMYLQSFGCPWARISEYIAFMANFPPFPSKNTKGVTVLALAFGWLWIFETALEKGSLVASLSRRSWQ